MTLRDLGLLTFLSILTLLSVKTMSVESTPPTTPEKLSDTIEQSRARVAALTQDVDRLHDELVRQQLLLRLEEAHRTNTWRPESEPLMDLNVKPDEGERP